MASRRQYLSQAELAEYANITITDPTEADDQISQAEELIDAYVGYQEKDIDGTFYGQVTSATSIKIVDLNPSTQLIQNDNFFAFCEIEVIGGTGAGQRRIITSSSRNEQSITVVSAFSPTLDNTSVFRIYQLGKFPRCQDIVINPNNQAYYKFIPEAVKRATAAQVEFMINQGAAYFASDKADMNRERIGNYEYEKGGSSGMSGRPDYIKLIAPKARTLLRGIRCITGSIEV